MIAWAVEFGNGLVAFFRDRGRAEKYAQDAHGEITELHSDDEEEPGETNDEE